MSRKKPAQRMTRPRAVSSKPQLEILEERTLLSGSYFEDFNIGPNGWISDGGVYRPSGGVGDSGYLEGHRDGFTPNFNPSGGNAAANTLGNLETLYGNLIQISYDGKVFQGPVNVPPHEGFYSADSSTLWIKTVAPSVEPFEGNWAHVSFEINTNWTDAEASANGWYKQFGNTSWSNTLHNVGWQEVFYALRTPSISDTEFITGLDNFGMQSVVTVQSVQVNDGSVQRSKVNSLTVTFSTIVSLDPGAFEVRHQNNDLVTVNFTSSVVGGKTVAVLTFAGDEIIGGSLADGNYTLTVLADHVHDANGNPLAADNVTAFYRLYGDTQGHRTVDGADAAVFFSTFGKHAGDPGYLSYLDYNGDGAIDDIDLYAFIARYSTTLSPP